MAGWDIVRAEGDARGFHAHGVPDEARRSVRVLAVRGSALALGSAQSIDDVDLEAADRLQVDVFNRRSGGGAVLLDPGAQVWIDLVIGRRDELWHDDIGVAARWVGDVWAAALRELGTFGEVHTGPMVSTPISSVVCFAGLAAGEVTVDGAKVVGISQRRTRAGARFQCSVPMSWDPDRHASLLAPGISRCGGSMDEVRVAPVDALGSVDEIVDVFIDALP